jgi:subtilase family serine protease
MRSFPAFLVALGVVAGPALAAQSANRIAERIDSAQVRVLPNHHPLWAVPANDAGAVPANQAFESLTLVLARSPEQEQAFKQFLADQQNPSSPDYKHWLTPDEVGQRFGLSDQDIATITGWLQSRGLHVNWVAPNHVFIGFGGTAADIGRAFQTEMHSYMVNGAQRFSVNANPMIPAAFTSAIKAVRGFYTINEQPTHHISAAQSASPQLTVSGSHFITPNDFDTIYDVPASVTGAGVTIGIVSWAHTNAADFNNFKSKTGATFANPTEVVPTAYGGIDPGPALTAPPSGSSSTLGGQEEATLDVVRAGSVAPAASLLLVVSSPTGANDGIGADAQYLVNTTPVPAQVMSISFGACESSAGSAGVAFWDSLFQSAAAEGISVFVSSGDSGAAGCDIAFSAPPASPKANSPNYLCSSSYATCVGGTQFADTASPSTYWSSTNGVGYRSANGYIPEGAWNESTNTSVAATGGGVSTVIATPSWQTGTGVPSARAGRYTPDVSFSSSGHDGYFACMAAISGGSCVTSGGSFGFVIFSGTSAASPGMAGVAALLDQKLGAAQGNLNPQLYSLAASAPTAFHDATVSSSGVSGCSVNTASICNNSIPKLSGSGTQAGFLLGTGYDEATGLGSVDVSILVNAWVNNAAPVPAVLTSPTPGTKLSGSSVTFTWTAGTSGTTGYWMWIGTTPGTADIANLGEFSGTSTTTTLPTGGATIYVRLWTVINGTKYLYNDYTYTQYGAPVPAVLTSPAQGAKLSGPSVTFTWTAGTSGTTGYWMWIGTTPGTANIANLGEFTGTSATTTLPTDGATIYVRLWTVINGTTYLYNDYTYTEYGTPVPAVLTSPTPGTKLGGSSVTFTWTAGTSGTTGYWMWIGTTPGTADIANLGEFSGTSTTTTLPTGGATVYVRLWTVINGTTYLYNDYAYTEYGTPVP